jgi:hypothetical protein
MKGGAKVEVREYIKHVRKICDDYDNKCGKCPLKGLPCTDFMNEEVANKMLKTVENYEARRYPFGRCAKCNKEFNSELVSEYNLSHCPWCGTEIGGTA